MEEKARNIPLPTKREIRQRCGFGCVICGKPLYEYHHMIEWSEAKDHNPNEITLLCDEHHKQVTNKLLAESTVRDANKKPYNLNHEVSGGLLLRFEGDSFTTVMGGMIVTNTRSAFTEFTPLYIDGVPILSYRFEDGKILISMRLYDRDNNRVFEINDNELSYSLTAWDIELIGNRIIIREKKRDILVAIELNLPHEINIYEGKIYCNGIELLINAHSLELPAMNMKLSSKITNAPIGLFLYGKRLAEYLARTGSSISGATICLLIPDESRYTYSGNTILFEDFK